jgi:HCOMODA/2-hydroxy-3-carboxy-muconic semialdehyde decarboxylase
MAPALVTAADVLTYDLDSNALDANGRTSYAERFIHGAIYKARPDVKAIVHAHTPSVIPFGVSGVRLQTQAGLVQRAWELSKRAAMP